MEEDYRYVSENLAWIGFGREASGADIAKDAVNFWKDSPAHQSNLMREDWEKTGIGLFWEEGKVCIVQMFAGM